MISTSISFIPAETQLMLGGGAWNGKWKNGVMPKGTKKKKNL